MRETYILDIESDNGIDMDKLWDLIIDQFPDDKITLLKKV